MSILIIPGFGKPFRKNLSFLLLFGVLLLAALLIQGLFSLGYVSIHANKAGLPEIVKSVEWQTWEKIIANSDPQTAVTLNFNQVSIDHALDQISHQTHLEWRWAWFVAPTPNIIAEGEKYFEQNPALLSEKWKVLAIHHPSDRRDTDPNLNDLHANLSKLAEQDDLVVFVPNNWNPELDSLPPDYNVQDLATCAGGSSAEVILLTDRLSFESLGIKNNIYFQ